MTCHPTRVGFIKLDYQHLEFCRLLTGAPFETLADGFNVFEDVGIAVQGRPVLLFEGFDEHAELRERVLRPCALPERGGRSPQPPISTGFPNSPCEQ